MATPSITSQPSFVHLPHSESTRQSSPFSVHLKTLQEPRRLRLRNRKLATVRAQARETSETATSTIANLSKLQALGRVLAPQSEGEGWWDDQIFSFPHVVTNADHALEGKYEWRMYYYGRDGPMWGQGIQPPHQSTPTGRVGMAVSEDGIKWKRYRGPLPGGAILDPDGDPTAFDCVQIGVGEVVPGTGEEEWQMFYFGGGLDGLKIPNTDKEMKGVRMRVGKATSMDGIHFKRKGKPILELGTSGDFDESSVGFPRVVPPARGFDSWVLTYHTLSFSRGFSIGAATSKDGEQWEKVGEVLGRGEEGAWDKNGAASRCILRIGDQLVMFYEGVYEGSRYSIGIATSEDGVHWEKDSWQGSQPGGPVFTPRNGEDVWDNQSVGTPNVVPMPDGSYRLYYTGQGQLASGKALRGFGLALSEGSNFRSWRRYDVGI